MGKKSDNFDIGGLLRRADGGGGSNAELPQKNLVFERYQRLIQEICASLIRKPIDYAPEDTVKLLTQYLEVVEGDTPPRLLYSEISRFIFSLDLDTRGDYVSNMDKLIIYTDSLPYKEWMCKEYAIKLYDHSQLAVYQTENASTVLQRQIEEIEQRFQKDLKNVEREYITILGIFASIVIAFFGEFAFSSSVLSNMSGVGIWRLLVVIDLLAFVLTNIIYLLVSFILKINGIKLEIFSIKKIWLIYLGVTLVIAVGWAVSAHRIPESLLKFMPWN